MDRAADEQYNERLLRMINALATFEAQNQPPSSDSVDGENASGGENDRGWGRLRKHLGKFKNGAVDRDAMDDETVDHQPMTSFSHVISRAMRRLRSQQPPATQATAAATNGVATREAPVAPPVLRRRETYTAKQRITEAMLKRQSTSFAVPSSQHPVEAQANTIADLVRALQAMRKIEPTFGDAPIDRGHHSSIFPMAVGAVRWKRYTARNRRMDK